MHALYFGTKISYIWQIYNIVSILIRTFNYLTYDTCHLTTWMCICLRHETFCDIRQLKTYHIVIYLVVRLFHVHLWLWLEIILRVLNGSLFSQFSSENIWNDFTIANFHYFNHMIFKEISESFAHKANCLTVHMG